jgi:F-type H+-transporting ATPase subunit a
LKTKLLFGFFIFFLISGNTIPVYSQNVEAREEEGKKFNASTYILEHIADSHEWHLFTRKNGKNVAIYLPVILYSKESGLALFSSRRLADGQVYKGFKIEEEGKFKDRKSVV